MIAIRLFSKVMARHANFRVHRSLDNQLLLVWFFQWVEIGNILLRPVVWNEGLLYLSGLFSTVKAMGLLWNIACIGLPTRWLLGRSELVSCEIGLLWRMINFFDPGTGFAGNCCVRLKFRTIQLLTDVIKVFIAVLLTTTKQVIVLEVEPASVVGLKRLSDEWVRTHHSLAVVPARPLCLGKSVIDLLSNSCLLAINFAVMLLFHW